MRSGLRIVLITFSVMLIAANAISGDPQSEAKKHREAGLNFYRSGQFALAAEALRQSYALDNNYETLYDLGQAESGANNYGAAIQAYSLYLQMGGAKVPIGLRETVQKEIQRLQFMASQSAPAAPTPGVPVPAPMAPAPVPQPNPQMNNMQAAQGYLQKGQAYEQQGNFEWAKAEYERAYSAYPDFNTLYLIGMMQLRLNQLQQARDTFTRFLAQGQAGIPPYRRAEVEQQIRAIDGSLAQVANQDQARKRFDQGRMHFANNRFDAAAVEFDASYRLYPNPECLYYLGKCAARQGQNQKASEAFNRYLQESGGKIPPSQREDVNRELAQLKTALEQEAKIQASKTKIEEGLRWFNTGNYVRAIDLYGQAYKIYPNFEVFYYLGQAEAASNNYTKARTAYERYLSEGAANVPKNLRGTAEKEITKLKALEAQEAAKKQSFDLYQKGLALSKKGNFEQALAEFEAAHKQYPDYRIQQGIGAASGELEQWDKAIKAYSAYMKEGGDQITPELRAQADREIEWLKSAKEAHKQFKKKKLEAALGSFEKAYAIHPHFQFLFYIGKIEAVFGNNVKALQSYKDFLSKGGNRVQPVSRSEAELEIERLNTLVKEEERREEARVKLDQGISLFEQGDNEKAVELLEQSYKLDAQYEVQYYLGGALQKLEKWTEAREAYDRYLNEGKGDINNARRKEVLAEIEHIKQIETDLENRERAESLYQKGMSLADRELYEDAMSAFEESYKVYPNHKALRGIGRAAIGQKRYSLAAGAYERYLREGEGQISGKMAVRIEKLIEKLKVKEEMAGKREESVAHFDTGLNLRTQGEYEEAVAEFQTAYDIFPSYKIHYSIGKAYGSAKKYDEAIEAYNRFLDEGKKKVKKSVREKVQGEIERLEGLKKIMAEKGVEAESEEAAVDKAREDDKPAKKEKKAKKKKPAKKKATSADLDLIP